ncbi:uncharacterized protein [Paramisgurnus dabryanus]|uniref:uncharacterized protein n=1 Tax=Paramisgurnus dabryanus TaxID=90735 RepID=UPI003CCFB11E
MHRTVLRHGQIVLQRCQSCCSNYHCPFCGPKVFKPTTNFHMVKNHVSNHLSLAVQHEDFLIVKCNLQCREPAHFHCCYCSNTVIRKVQLIKHLALCTKRQVPPTETATVETAAINEPIVTCEPVATSEPILSSAAAVAFKEPAIAEVSLPVNSLPVNSLPVLKNVRIPKKVQCVHCGVTINKKNLNVHVKRKHTKKICDVTENRHLPSQCIDPVSGIYAVEKSFYRPCSVIHVQKKTSGSHPVVVCETDECSTNADLATRSGFQHFECIHLKSLQFCPWPNMTPVVLEEDVLLDMIAANVFGEQAKKICIDAKLSASAAGVPLSVEVTIGGPSSKKYISIYESKVSYYSRLGRVIASYDSTRNTWHCPCAKPRRSCLHKNIAKWHLFQVHRELFTSPIDQPTQGLAQEHAFQEYPPSGEGLKKMVYYLMKNKTLPAELPQKYVTGSISISDIPRHLVPKETVCAECTGNVVLSEPVLITSKGKCITYTGIVEGFSTYYRMCSNCGLKYRYQEWTEGLHNFDDHLLMSLHMCVVLPHSLQTHHAISRAVEVLETTTQQKFPRKDKILHAYMHFEALTDHDYAYSCVKCGYHPAVVVMDLHKKAAFNMPVSEIPDPPPEYDGQINLKDFWTSVTAEVVCRGLLGSACQNPFLVSPSYHYCAPWIGPNTRREDTVLNTEYAKMHAPRPATEDAELQVTEERLEEVLTNLKVDVVRRLCKQCGVDPSGSKMDLVLRLRQEMRNRSSYDKVFQKGVGQSSHAPVELCIP